MSGTADTNDQSQPLRDPARDEQFDAEHGAQGAPNGKPQDRGSREGDPAADTIMPGREFGAGGQVDDGPSRTGGGA